MDDDRSNGRTDLLISCPAALFFFILSRPLLVLNKEKKKQDDPYNCVFSLSPFSLNNKTLRKKYY